MSGLVRDREWQFRPHQGSLRGNTTGPINRHFAGPYLDRITGQTIAPVTTGQIYWGALPFLVIQILMVGITIAFPTIVTHYKAAQTVVDPAAVENKLDNLLGGDAQKPTDLPPLF